jgi:hypothetical protein
MTDLTNLSNPGPIKTYSEEYWANRQNQPSAPHRAGGDRVARDRVGLTEEAKKRFAILGDCSTPAKPEYASVVDARCMA